MAAGKSDDNDPAVAVAADDSLSDSRQARQLARRQSIAQTVMAEGSMRIEDLTARFGVIEYDGQDRSIDVRISRIRPKIGDDPMHPRLIKTVRSKGYLFVGEG